VGKITTDKNVVHEEVTDEILIIRIQDTLSPAFGNTKDQLENILTLVRLGIH
jgi:hypothetical protein